MKAPRVVAAILILAVIAFIVWFFLLRPTPQPGTLTIYYTNLDGNSLGTWTITRRPAEQNEGSAAYLQYEVRYAAVQNVAGPPSGRHVIRFPPGTRVDSASIDGSTADIDLSNDVTQQSGTFGENGEFKALVYTLTAIPGIDAVQITIAGRRLQTLPHGSLELDTPLRRSDW